MKELSNPPAIVKPAEDLATLAKQINRGHREVEKWVEKSLERARQIGEWLLAAKQQCGHGHWLTWLNAKVTFSQQTAHKYMTIAEGWNQITTDGNSSQMSISKAYRLLMHAEEEPEPEENSGETSNLTSPSSPAPSPPHDFVNGSPVKEAEVNTNDEEGRCPSKNNEARHSDHDAETECDRPQPQPPRVGPCGTNATQQLTRLCRDVARSLNLLLTAEDGREHCPNLPLGRHASLEQIAQAKKGIDAAVRNELIEALHGLGSRCQERIALLR